MPGSECRPAARERRQVNRHHVEPIVEVIAEAARGNLLLKRQVGGRDDANVHADRPAIADALELALLQHPQELHLQAKAHARDFVKKKRARVSRLESADLVIDGARERPFDVAIQLAFEQALAQRRRN